MNEQWSRYIGKVGYLPNGRALTKCAAIDRTNKLEPVVWHDKPGWENGILLNDIQYMSWLKDVKF
jgi:hypothetical protein